MKHEWENVEEFIWALLLVWLVGGFIATLTVRLATGHPGHGSLAAEIVGILWLVPILLIILGGLLAAIFEVFKLPKRRWDPVVEDLREAHGRGAA